MDLDALLASTADGAFTVGPDGRIASWNRAAERLTGYAAREVVGRSCCEVLTGRDAAGNLTCYPGCQVRALAARGEPVQAFDMGVRGRGGRRMWLNVSVLTVPATRGAPVTVHLFRDVTATREIEALVRARLAAPADASDPGGVAPDLTRRETEVLRLLAAGASTRAMAEQLGVSPATVRNHVQNILGKLGLHSRLEAAAYAARHGLR
jgi:PAS domain S-box-containing protein